MEGNLVYATFFKMIKGPRAALWPRLVYFNRNVCTEKGSIKLSEYKQQANKQPREMTLLNNEHEQENFNFQFSVKVR